MDMSLHVKKKWNWWRNQKRTEMDKLLKHIYFGNFWTVAMVAERNGFQLCNYYSKLLFLQKSVTILFTKDSMYDLFSRINMQILSLKNLFNSFDEIGNQARLRWKIISIVNPRFSFCELRDIAF